MQACSCSCGQNPCVYISCCWETRLVMFIFLISIQLNVITFSHSPSSPSVLNLLPLTTFRWVNGSLLGISPLLLHMPWPSFLIPLPLTTSRWANGPPLSISLLLLHIPCWTSKDPVPIPGIGFTMPVDLDFDLSNNQRVSPGQT